MSREQITRVATLVGGLAIAAALSSMQGCHEPRENVTPASNRCTACHGSASRDGSDLEKAAPPIDLGGGTDSSRRGVGAHQIHLAAGPTHGKVACETCHAVPDAVDTPGHADDKLPAEIVLGGLATHDGASPAYGLDTATCSDTYCHGPATPTWTAPRSSAEACGSCHGLPPPPPHAQFEDCSRCHGDVIDKSRNFIAPERHVDGTVDVEGLVCGSCHGSPESNAPPVDLAGNTDKSAIGVGAHQAHLAGGQNSRALDCSECHTVPQSIDQPGHIDETPFAEVTFSGVALTGGGSVTWSRATKTCAASWCHGPSAPASSLSPEWTRLDGPLGCTDCHGKPPPSPHPQIERCSMCHGDVIGPDDVTIVNRAKHVNGEVDYLVPSGCNTCHGNETNAAPPKDLAGNTLTTSPGVGAHQSHSKTSSTVARVIQCTDCHLVPQSVLASGHMDTPLPAELTWSSVATGLAGQMSPSFDGTSCSNVWCHSRSGASNPSPIWTSVGTVQCGSCHGVPPSSHASYPSGDGPCGNCHSLTMSGWTFKDPTLHVNGKVDGATP